MKIVLSIAAVLIILFLLIRFLEYKSLYFPLKKVEATPKDIDLDYEDIVVTTTDGVQISGWFIPARKPRATLLFCHGNGGNISHRLEKINMFNFLNLNVLIFDYRGYGKSKGSPSEKGLYHDAEAIYAYLLNKKGFVPQEIIAYGESLGGAVAVDLASRHELGGIIIEEGFTSARDIGKTVLPFIPSSFYKSEFDSLKKIKNIKSPKLIFHSPDDEIVPFKLGKRLYDEAPEPKEFVQLQGGHNDAFLTSQELFLGKIDSFVGRL
ncbi:MAG: alpha/beta hydrolase [Nitrospirae bacterium]|nr:alpha/beta hydrolase [Nitrospirota bacterium]